MSKRLKISLTGLLEAAALVTVAFSVLTAFDSLHRYLELFSHFRLQYLAGAMILLLAFAVLKNWRFAALMLVATVVNAYFVVPWYWYNAAEAEATSSLKIMSANILASNMDFDRLLIEIDSQDPDIIFFQEVTDFWKAALESISARYPYNSAVSRDDPFGIAVYSRHVLTDIQVAASPPNGFPSLTVSLRLDDVPLRLISTHAMPPLGRLNFEARNHQLSDIGNQAGSADSAVILIGDLNTSMWGNHYRQLEHASGLRNAQRGFGIHPSWPLFLPIAMIPIDHCLVSPEVIVQDFRTGGRIGSDHLPIVVTISLATQ